jgi:hypothetical protein
VKTWLASAIEEKASDGAGLAEKTVTLFGQDEFAVAGQAKPVFGVLEDENDLAMRGEKVAGIDSGRGRGAARGWRRRNADHRGLRAL